MPFVPLTQGFRALIDEEDVELIMAYRWKAKRRKGRDSAKWYAYRQPEMVNGKLLPDLQMHRLIIGALSGQQVDHVNGDTLDNRRRNLRIATHGQNVRNRPRPSTNTSGFKGVTRNCRTGKWQAQIGIGGRQRYLGSFLSVIDAAEAYDSAARRVEPIFAYLNNPKARAVNE